MTGYLTLTIDSDKMQLQEHTELPDVKSVVNGDARQLFHVPSPFRNDVRITGYVNAQGIPLQLPKIGCMTIWYKNKYHGQIIEWFGNMVVVAESIGSNIMPVPLTNHELQWLKAQWSESLNLLKLEIA